MQTILKIISSPINTISMELRMTSARSTYVCQRRRYRKPKNDAIVKISDIAKVKTCSVRLPLKPAMNVKQLNSNHQFI